jgi:sugar phosphate isomerase/epimerase
MPDRRYQFSFSLDTVVYTGNFYRGEALPLEECIRKAKEFGYDGVELCARAPQFTPYSWNEPRARELKRLADYLGLPITGLGAFTNFGMPRHTQHDDRHKEYLYLRELCRLAQAVGTSYIRIFAGWNGWFIPTDDPGPIYEKSDDTWQRRRYDWAVEGLREAAQIAQDHGIVLGLQNHPPITMNYQECNMIVRDIGMKSLRTALDLPLLLDQSDAAVRQAVLETRDILAPCTHIIGIVFRQSLAGTYGFYEVPPGEPEDSPDRSVVGRENWKAYFKALMEIGYRGSFAYEQCSPVNVDGYRYRLAGREEVDRRFRRGLQNMKRILGEIGYQ